MAEATPSTGPRKMNVLPGPCTTCPYRKDVPAGIWSAEEYEKLRGYDDPQTSFAAFLCHQSPEIGRDTLCRGWLSVHCESVAARLLLLAKRITRSQLYATVKEVLYASGNEAADAGLRGVARPSRQAKRAIRRLTGRKHRFT